MILAEQTEKQKDVDREQIFFVSKPMDLTIPNIQQFILSISDTAVLTVFYANILNL
jgi:hypothetical protein